MNHATLVIDTETTGLFEGDKAIAPDLLTILEVGAVLVTADGETIDEFEVLIRPSEYVLNHPAIQPALELTGITKDELIERGGPSRYAANRLVDWVEKCRERVAIRYVTSFNVNFDSWFLKKDPWFFARRAKLRWEFCIMLDCMDLMGEAGALPPASWYHKKKNPHQQWKWPNANEAARFFRDRGHEIRDHDGRQHRALADARVEADILVALAREKGGRR